MRSTIELPHPSCGRHAPCPSVRTSLLGIAPVASLVCLEGLTGSPFVAFATLHPHHDVGAIVGCGVSAVRAEAKMIAIVEVIERLSSHLPARAPLEYGAPEVFAARCIPCQAPRAIPRWWLSADRLDLDGEVLVPIEYFQLARTCKVRDPLILADSTGIAVHTDMALALAAAEAEVHERALLWEVMAGRPDWRWPGAAASPQVTLYLGACRELGYTALVMGRTRQHTLVAILLLAAGPGPYPALVAGAAAARTPELALHGAMREAYGKLLHALHTGVGPPCASPEVARALLERWQLDRTPAVDAPPEPQWQLQPIAGVADRGNVLTDALGLYAIQVVVPDFPRPGADTTIHGLPSPFI